MDWTRGPTIGRGASATISLAIVSTSGELFAVKSTELSRSKLLQREQSFLSQLSSERIVKYLGSNTTCEGDTMLYNVFMEYVPGGALSDEIRRRGNRLDEDWIRLYTRQIVLGLEYLQFNGLVHCDIKSENVLIREDGAVIADLGCAKSVHGNGGGSVFSGTPVFMAPEVARGEEQGFPADVWALGCTVIEMATGRNPWPEVDDPVSALYRIGFSGDVPEFPMWLSENGRDFLDKCLRRNPRERWTAKELLEHPFLEPNSKQLKEFPVKSPTSVLDDQGFWDSLEAPVTPSVLMHIGSSSNSPAERIQRLNEGALSSGSNLPNWTWDEDWVTVRSNYIEESARFSDNTTTTLVMASFVHEEEPENLVLAQSKLESPAPGLKWTRVLGHGLGPFSLPTKRRSLRFSLNVSPSTLTFFFSVRDTENTAAVSDCAGALSFNGGGAATCFLTISLLLIFLLLLFFSFIYTVYSSP
uniref:mitogen-activated protein kinase kinase kinase n=1 Tax=Vitis vinifera TaxID=29760 RepID=F6HEQ4_VITVI